MDERLIAPRSRARVHEPVTLERLKEEVAAYMRENGMNPWYASHMMELIQIGWERVEEDRG